MKFITRPERAGGILRQRRLFMDSLLLGIVGAISAQLFTWMLELTRRFFLHGLANYDAPGLPQEGGILQQVVGPLGLWLIPVATTLGGLISGLLVYSLAPEAEGHGTDTVVEAFHQLGGYIRARVPPLKMVASAVTIGSGGAAGREGPTALISAGIGAIYAQLTKRNEHERRLLLLIGMAAGLSAIFRSPIGTAFFAIEVLYSGMEFDAAALLFTLLASIVAYALNGLFVGWRPLFAVPALPMPAFGDYLWYAALGILGGVIGALLPGVFYGVRDFFHRIPIKPQVKPALGGLAVGLMALYLPQVLGGGYGWIQEAINGQLAAGLLITLVFAKMLAFSLTVGSGGSGGIFAPSLYVGAMLGGFLAQILNQSPAAFVVVGMAAVFSGAARVPIATLIMVTEMTGGYHLLPAAALTVVLSYSIQEYLTRFARYPSLYEAQVPGRPDSPAHHVEHLEAALSLIASRRVQLPQNVSTMDLRALLASGLPIELPGEKRLFFGSLKAESRWIGKKVGDLRSAEDPQQLEIVALFQEGRTILPEPGHLLQAGDRLLVIAGPGLWRSMKEHLAPLTTEHPPTPGSDGAGSELKPSRTAIQKARPLPPVEE